MSVQEFKIRDGNEFIALNQLLKVLGWVENGAMANHVIVEGLVTLNDSVETKKRAKIRLNDIVGFDGSYIKIV